MIGVRPRSHRAFLTLRNVQGKRQRISDLKSGMPEFLTHGEKRAFLRFGPGHLVSTSIHSSREIFFVQAPLEVGLQATSDAVLARTGTFLCGSLVKFRPEVS